MKIRYVRGSWSEENKILRRWPQTQKVGESVKLNLLMNDVEIE